MSGDVARLDLRRPEEAVRLDAGIEVVNLRATRALEDVKSYERERAVSAPAVRTDELAFHEAQVDLERKARDHSTGRLVRAGPRSPDVREPDVAVEVRDRDWVVRRRIGAAERRVAR